MAVKGDFGRCLLTPRVASYQERQYFACPSLRHRNLPTNSKDSRDLVSFWKKLRDSAREVGKSERFLPVLDFTDYAVIRSLQCYSASVTTKLALPVAGILIGQTSANGPSFSPTSTEKTVANITW